MKTFIFICSFLLMASLSFAQDCKVFITNTTGNSLMIGIRKTVETPNICTPPTEDITLVIPPGVTEVSIGTVLPGEPPFRPFIVGAAFWPTMTSASWQVNQCWNPACIDSDGPLDINFTYCSDYETHITI